MLIVFMASLQPPRIVLKSHTFLGKTVTLCLLLRVGVDVTANKAYLLVI